MGSIRIGSARSIQEPAEFFGPRGPVLAMHVRDVQGEGTNFQKRPIDGGHRGRARAIGRTRRLRRSLAPFVRRER